MSRRIITARDLAPATFTAAARDASVPTADGYRDKLVKYIPAEVVSAYLSIDLVIRSSNSESSVKVTTTWIVFGILLVATPIYLRRVLSLDRWLQIWISTLAFAVWVFAMGGPFLSWAWVDKNRFIGAIVLTLFTFFIPLIDPDHFEKKP